MNDTYGQTYSTPFAQYDPDTRSWRTSAVTSLWALPMSSLTLPKSGGLVNGELFERPMLEHPTAGNASSSLPTPKARDHKDQSFPNYLWIPNEYGSELPKAIARQFLPTPTARDHKDVSLGPRMQSGRGHGALPQMIAESFLPTPTTADGLKMSSNPATSQRRREKGNQVSLTDLVQTEMLPPGQEHRLLSTPRARLSNNDDVSKDRGKRNLEDQISHLLPTPAVNDMGAGKDPQAWNEWAARQKAADGRPAPHGKSLEQEALAMLPTPRAADHKGAVNKTATTQRRVDNGQANLPEAVVNQWTGESTPPQSDDGKLF
jgi:hypothetical protein